MWDAVRIRPRLARWALWNAAIGVGPDLARRTLVGNTVGIDSRLSRWALWNAAIGIGTDLTGWTLRDRLPVLENNRRTIGARSNLDDPVCWRHRKKRPAKGDLLCNLMAAG